MKKIVLLIGFCILFTGFVSLRTHAQEVAPPENFVVFEEFVSPSDMPAFRKVQDKVFELMDKHSPDFTFYCYRNDENAFYWVIPLENFASMDALFAKSMAFQKKMKEVDGFDGDKEFRDLSTGRQTILHLSKELSYHPSGEFGQTLDNTFIEWTFCYMKTGHEKEAGAAIKKYIDFYNSIDETYDWDVYTALFGHDTPMWIIMTRAKSELAVRELEDDLNSKYEKEFEKMWQEFASHVRRFENKKGWFLPNWSRIIPQE